MIDAHRLEISRLRPAGRLALAILCTILALPAAAQDYGGGSGGSSVQPPAPPPPTKQQTADGEEEEERIRYPINKRVSRYLAESLKLMQANQLPEAQALLEKIQGSSRLNKGEQAKVEQFLGNISAYKNDQAGAAKHLARALELKGLDPQSEQQVTFQLASTYAQLEDYPKALATLDKWFAAADAPSGEAYYLKAVIMIQSEKPAEAVIAAEQAVALTPNPREGWLSLLAHANYLVKDYQKMATTLEQLVALSPTKKSYWILLSAAYFELDRDEEARAIVQLAYRQGLLDKDREILALARLLLANGLPLDAAAVLEKGMADKLVPEQKDSYELLTNAFLQAREEDQALAPLTKGAEISDDAQLYILLGKVELQRDDFDAAIKALNAGLAKAKPDQRARLYLLIGVAQLGADRLEEAERAFRSALGDAKTQKEADSYLKFVTQERGRRVGMGA